MPERWYDKKSGILIVAPEEYQNMNHPRIRKGPKGGYVDERYNESGRIYEHIIVAERMLGRQLEPKEVVFHLDYNKMNNDPKNLKVFKNQGELIAWIKRQKEVT